MRSAEDLIPVVYLLRLETDELYGGIRSALLSLSSARSVAPHLIVYMHREAKEIEGIASWGLPYEVVRAPRWERRNSRVGRWLSMIVANGLLVPRLWRAGWSIVHVDAENFWYAGLVATALRRPSVMHLRNHQGRQKASVQFCASLFVATKVVAITPSLLGHILETLPTWLRGRVSDKVSVIVNGIDLCEIDTFMERVSRQEARGRLGIGEEAIAVGMVGGIEPRKMQLELLSVLEDVLVRYRNLRVLIVGGAKDAEYFQACREFVKRAGLTERVQFAGYQNSVFTWFRAMDVLTFPSRREGFGRVAVEAAAFGVPVVASKTIGLVDAVEDGKNGVLVEDVAGFAGVLIQLIEEPELRRKLGECGLGVAKRFDASTVVRSLELLYGEIVGGKNEKSVTRGL